MNEQTSKLKDFFKSKDDILLAFLFGSQAKNKAARTSDYDIGVWFKDGPTTPQTNKLWEELVTLLHKEVDLVVLNTARPTVAWSAIRGQKLLIRDFKLYLKLFLDISREAEDMQDFTISFWNWKKRVKEYESVK